MTANRPVAVFGATGFIGRHLVQRLRQASVPVIVPCAPNGDRLDIAMWDESLTTAVAEARVVVNAAGTAHSHSANPADFWPANAIGARNVARAVAAATDVERLVHLSSVAVGAGGLEPAVADFHPFTAYGASKAAGEIAAAAELATSRSDLVVVRPAGIGGAGSPGAWGTIRDLVAAGKRVPVPDSSVRHNVIEIEAVVDFLASAIAGETPAGVVALPGPSPMTIREYVDFVGGEIGVKPRTVRVPHWALSPLLASTAATERAVQPVRRAGQVLSTLIRQRPLVIEHGGRPRHD